MLNTFFHSLITFVDLAALSSVAGTVLCLHWTVCTRCELTQTNPCFDSCRRLLLFCLIGLSLSSIGDLMQRTMEMAGLGITEIIPVLPTVVLRSHYGSMWILRAACVLVLWVTWFTARRRLDSRIAAFLLLLACAVIAFSRSASSHAADYGDFSLQQLSDWLHLLSATMWGGALVSIALTINPSLMADVEQQHNVASVADRFYAFFGPVFAVLVATGLYNTWIEVRSMEALLTTAYGRFLSAKLLIVSYLTFRYIAPPQRGKDEAVYAASFLKRARIEAILILVILLCVALFTHEVPARHALHIMPDHEHKMDSNHDQDPEQGMSHHMEHGHGM